MNINKNNTAIIFGCSPFINKISEQDMNYLIDNYYHIGLNNFVLKYPKTKNVLFTDYRDWETDRKSTRLNSSHSAKSRMPSSA